ncbi:MULTISPECIES: hypothetical protein [unclassified Rhodococcus (in: high G+C Gram-positive bacteria)]|uniref:hypothetical protein n=1 Tax=unclassified Rhodococcus (in: high G+C Gram-positive bacteria) TaxID=192944 RepID=UPI00117A971B|nr:MULTISPECIES: hypothetical protein [unclassified Rhodococcus (in: high G+C Gram-positive bacteria)]
MIRGELHRFPAFGQRELDDVVQDFLVDRVKPLTVMLMTQATDQDSFDRLLRRSIRNWLIDQVRATAIGAIRRSLEKVLKEEDDFETIPAGEEGAGRWRLVGLAGNAPWGGDPAVLVAAAWNVSDVRVPKWSSGTRRPPIADRASIVSILRAILMTADGSLETAQIVHVLARRFAAALDPVERPISDADSEEFRSEGLSPEELVIATDSEVDAASAAWAIFSTLSDDERSILPVVDNPAEVQKRLGLGRSQASQLASRCKAKIANLAGTGPEARQVALEVIWLCGGPAAH